MDNDMFSKISDILGDPDSAEKIKQIAGSFMDTDNTESSDGHSERRTGSSPNINNDKISSLLSSMGGSTNNKNIALLNAITPYMRESRATKINSAIKAIQVINILSSLQ